MTARVRRCGFDRCAALLAAAVMLGLQVPTAGYAQDPQPGQVRSQVLVIDAERLYRDSTFGRRISAEIDAESEALAKENRAIEAELGSEEQALTDQRATLDAAAFRDLADAFDQKVRQIRREQDEKARQLSLRQENARGAFLSAAAPVLEAMMLEAGAAVVLERRSVFLSLTAVDITRAAVQRIDRQIGDGTTPSASPGQATSQP